MKELSIKEKARRYDEAIEELRAMMPNWENLSYNGKTFLQDLVHIIPELKESEGERMVKFIKNQLFNIKKTITENYELDAKLTKAIAWLEKQGEQKPAWSEEDEDIINKILCICDDFAKSFEISPASTKVIKEDVDKIDNWLKSIKGRVLPKQEWSKEDTEHLNSICATLKEKANERPFDMPSYYDKQIDWLKSLRPQPQWKPSDEQMDALETAVSSLQSTALESLYNKLKKL